MPFRLNFIRNCSNAFPFTWKLTYVISALKSFLLKNDFAFPNRTKNGVHRNDFVERFSTTSTSMAPPGFGTTAETAEAVKPLVVVATSMRPEPTRWSNILFFFFFGFSFASFTSSLFSSSSRMMILTRF